MEDNILPQRTGFVELEPELTVLQGGTPWLRLRISDGGRSYVVKSLEELLSHIENNQVVSYGKSLAFQHRWDAFTPEARQLLNLLRREIINGSSWKRGAIPRAATRRPARPAASH